MDFFEAQARAKKRTTRLVALFVLAVAGIVVTGYVAALVIKDQLAARYAQQQPRYDYVEVNYGESAAAPSSFVWWDPQLFFGILAGTTLIVGFASLYKWLHLRQGGPAVAQQIGARAVALNTTDPRERQLLNIVEEMAIASGMPVPGVYVMEDEKAINAFAAGLAPNDSVVAVTRGTLEKLSRDELQGVVAHEFSHILNGDSRLNIRLTAVLFGILVIGLLGRGILESLRHTRVRSSNNDKNGGGIIVVVLVIGLLLMILGYIGYFFGRLIQAAVSRQREFLADSSAVQFTRNPGGITGALKKIGGYALGSRLQNPKAAEFNHFFFAQNFQSSLGGSWATHPPLATRILAIEPAFDGTFFKPPEVVDIARETWPASHHSGSPASPSSPAHPLRSRAPAAEALIATIGTLSAAHTERAHALFTQIPPALHEAAHTPEGAAALACGLLLDTDPGLRTSQLTLTARHAGEPVARKLAGLLPDIETLAPDARLPLLLLLPPALRQLPPDALARVLEALDELVHADGHVNIFEFTLQKVLARQLGLGTATTTSGRETYSPAQVSHELSVVLSAAARLSAPDDNELARLAFNAGAAQFAGLHPQVVFLDAGACSFAELDPALDKLALSFGPVKKRVLTAVATILAFDSRFDTAEAEFLRALASALDCPMPPVI